ncbi:hypothetical protein NDU88_002916 [Pleurodeles waltl]|uniref:Uncharacterized protein n=1 Tax=Pleurodeles waltl TaxID=8319 RepID=A0AAV7UB82_PLEWA|nr:hypothetical protein NDU88_002916 [Pleurodeles waltl]
MAGDLPGVRIPRSGAARSRRSPAREPCRVEPTLEACPSCKTCGLAVGGDQDDPTEPCAGPAAALQDQRATLLLPRNRGEEDWRYPTPVSCGLEPALRPGVRGRPSVVAGEAWGAPAPDLLRDQH